jgi:uncharacterized phage protein (TIGR02218 family)
LLQIELANGTIYYYTDLDQDVVFETQVYKSALSFSISSVQVVIGTSTSSYSVNLSLDTSAIDRAIIEGGGLDAAPVTVLLVDYNALADGSVLLLKGVIDEIEYRDTIVASIDISTLLSQNLQIFVEAFSSNCRADLGDARCKVNIDALKKSGVVSTVLNPQVFTSNLTDPNGAFDFGLVHFTSGQNNDIALEVGTYANASGTVTLQLIAPFTLVPGDTFTIYPGCDKTLLGGCTKYMNWPNFRGEPFFALPSTIAATASTVPPTTVITSVGASSSNIAIPRVAV